MSDQTITPNANANGQNVPSDKPKRSKAQTFTVQSIARARLRKRGIKNDDRLGDECKVVRGMLRRGSNWEALRKAAPKAYGPRGSIKTAANDRRPWGPIPTNVARAVIDGKR